MLAAAATFDIRNATFEAQIEAEFCTGSAIARPLYAAATRIVHDTEVSAGGEVSYPIHEALNWHLTRFGRQARSTLSAILLLNEDSSPWQAKLSQPRTLKGKENKYEFAIGGGVRAFLPAIDLATWLKVSQNHNLTGFLPTWVKSAIANGQKDLVSHTSGKLAPEAFEHYAGKLQSIFAMPAARATAQAQGFASAIEKRTSQARTLSQISPLRESQRLEVEFPIETSSFWEWVELLPIKLILTEGGKKALCLLSQGEVAIALIGINGGYRAKNPLGQPCRPYLIPDVTRFCQPGRQITLAFDQDIKEATRRRVAVAIHRFSALLQQAGCEVAIAQWESHQGKGVDDLIVQSGIQAWESAYLSALTFEDWQLWQRLAHRLTLPADLQVEMGDLSQLEIANLPERGLIAIASSKGTGKTKLASQVLGGVERVIAGGHRIALIRNLSERLGLDYLGDVDKAAGKFIAGAAYTLRLGLCVDSLLAIDPNTFAGCDLVLDEVVQVVRHLLTSSTCAKDGREFVQQVAGRSL